VENFLHFGIIMERVSLARRQLRPHKHQITPLHHTGAAVPIMRFPREPFDLSFVARNKTPVRESRFEHRPSLLATEKASSENPSVPHRIHRMVVSRRWAGASP